MVMQKNDLQFEKGDYVEVDGRRGYVNCICIASPSHLHPQKPMSYFTLTLEGTERTPRAVNLLIFEMLWSSVKVLEQVDNYPDYKSQEHRYSDPQ